MPPTTTKLIDKNGFTEIIINMVGGKAVVQWSEHSPHRST